jgi:signal transduction histidine kinase/CheY-like chemotaxis protein
MVGRNAIEFIYRGDLEATRQQMRSGRRERSITHFDCRYLHKDGRAVLLSWAGAWSDAAQRHFFIGRDMTERHAMEEQLRQSQKMEAVGQLTGGVAHDFNNLLTVIIGNADSLSHALRREPELQSLADMTANAALRGAELTGSLLAFARKQPLEPRATDINVLVSEMEPLLRRTLGERVVIDIRCAPDLWVSMIDPAQLETAMLNLVVNARDAMPDGGRLIIETANVELDEDYARQNPGLQPGLYVAISVADSGSGMTPEVAGRAFDPFFTTKETGKGTGLGLSMVYGFVKQSNGHIKIYSELGRGTTVKLYVPRIVGADAEPRAPARAAEVRGGGETILAVEDDAGVRDYVERQLKSLGYDVHTARDADEALALLQRLGRIDLLFTDVVMPGRLDGPRLAEAARKLQPGLKVLYTSGYTENAIVHQGRLDASVELLNKPYRRQDLAAKLRKLLDAALVT